MRGYTDGETQKKTSRGKQEVLGSSGVDKRLQGWKSMGQGRQMGKKVGEEKQPSQNMFKNAVVKLNSLETNKKQVKDSKCSMSDTILS